jgi:hypothetical protein
MLKCTPPRKLARRLFALCSAAPLALSALSCGAASFRRPLAATAREAPVVMVSEIDGSRQRRLSPRAARRFAALVSAPPDGYLHGYPQTVPDLFFEYGGDRYELHRAMGALWRRGRSSAAHPELIAVWRNDPTIRALELPESGR